MTRPHRPARDERLPERMRDYRIEAEPRQSPDLHKLVQLFIGVARARTQDAQRPAPWPEPDSTGPVGGDEVESSTQEANG
ncbi:MULTISPECIES: hypothetical protein [Micrococcales]|uniref:Uncharacterized protein n=1 Tax=Sediminivirga luteola TaxID=1774748 RepID=A0A8J2TYD9_9MICO|nr:hypothetical protein [Sediminivirga luteola]GGA16219.1 hypothetical protein GCM10011333_19100 [Sediminivirga luteola]